jgi:hypothetical protein
MENPKDAPKQPSYSRGDPQRISQGTQRVPVEVREVEPTHRAPSGSEARRRCLSGPDRTRKVPTALRERPENGHGESKGCP